MKILDDTFKICCSLCGNENVQLDIKFRTKRNPYSREPETYTVLSAKCEECGNEWSDEFGV